MDPVTALGLACNILALVEQSIEAANMCKELYERGSLNKNDKIEEYANNISATNKDLEAMIRKTLTTTPCEPNLQKITKDSCATAAELAKELGKLKVSGQSRLEAALMMSLKTVVNKRKIDRLRTQLEGQDAQLRSGLLKRLYIKAGEDNITRRNEFQALSQGHKDIIAQALSRLQLISSDTQAAIQTSEATLMTRLDQQDVQLEQRLGKLSVDIPSEIKGSETKLISHLAAQDTVSKEIESRVLNRFDAQDLIIKDSAQKYNAQIRNLQAQDQVALEDRLIGTLAVPEMYERRKMIEDRVADFGTTYRWIFELPQSATKSKVRAGWRQPQHNFPQWLRSGKEIFCINGILGSGKSTLMDFIYQNLQPKGMGFEHLEEWASPHSVRLLDFWFYRPAESVLLKSLEGFYRSLCFQILETDRDLLRKIYQDTEHSTPETLRYFLQGSGPRRQSWTNRELKSWLIHLLEHSEHHYCLLIDGLDEVATDRQALLDTIEDIAHISEKVKICCATRPEAPFRNLLEIYPHLQLQDLNFKDIESHCHELLGNTRGAHFAKSIAYQSKGVFLWAFLVTRELRRGIDNGDAEEDLQLRFEGIPAGMNELFTHLLERQDEFYAKHPKPYLRLLDVATKKNLPVTILELLIASQDQNKLKADFPKSISEEFLSILNTLAVDLEVNIVARYAGLVECKEEYSASNDFIEFLENFPFKALVKAANIRARFVHRSAQDFLAESERGAALLQADRIPEQEALKRLMTAAAVNFLINAMDTEIEKPLEYAECIQSDFWSSFETTVVDALFQTRPLEMPRLPISGGNEPDDYWPGSFKVLCPQLSPHENLVFTYATTFNLLAYLETKLTTLDLEKSGLAAAYSICHELEISGASTENKAIELFRPYVLWMQNITLYYSKYSMPPHSVATHPVWQHVYLALTNAWYKGPRSAEERRYFPMGLVDDCFINTKQESLRIDGWLVRTSYSHGARIFPAPRNDFEMALNKQQLGLQDIFKIQVIEHKSADSWVTPTLHFCQYSPPGLDRFLDIEPSVNEALQDFYVKRGFRIVGSHPGERVDILNHHLSELSPAEIATVLGRCSYEPCVIFSEGRFFGASSDERWAWANRLMQGVFSKDFDTDPEHDPILREILELKNIW